MNLDEKIEEYSEQLFSDLGLLGLPEEGKADLYARVQEHMHKVILNGLAGKVTSGELSRAKAAMDQENYHELRKILKKHQGLKDGLEEKLEQEFKALKLIIAEEQKHAGAGEKTSS